MAQATTCTHQLKENDFVYRKLVARAKRMASVNDEKCLEAVEVASNFAWKNHPGRFSDGSIENIALSIGRNALEVVATKPRATSRLSDSSLRILHVVTSVYGTGGHSRVLAKWIRRDSFSKHSVVFTNQVNEIPSFLSDVFERDGVQTDFLDGQCSRVDRATKLRHLCVDFDMIVMHTHPDDTIPIVAFAQMGLPPVLFFNHAHFWFSLGTSVAEVVLNTHEYFRNISRKFRGDRKTIILRPSGQQVNEPLLTQIDKRTAKHAIGVCEAATVLLSVGSPEYYSRVLDRDFFQTVFKVLTAVPSSVLVIAGPDSGDVSVPEDLRQRVFLLGRIEDLTPYYLAADLFLESFPFPSLGAVLEACSIGETLPVLAYGKGETILRINLPFVSDAVSRATNEEAYIDGVVHHLKHLDMARVTARRLRQVIIDADRCFSNQFGDIYRQTLEFDHRPNQLHETTCRADLDNLAMAATSHYIGLRHLDYLTGVRYLAAEFAASFRGFQPFSSAVSNVAGRAIPGLLRRIPERVR